MTTTIARRVLPADVYDTLEFVAEAYDGVGRGSYYYWEGWERSAPNCIIGMASFACSDTVVDDYECGRALRRAGIDERVNDKAFVRAEARIPFAEWCKRLNVVRGES